MIHYNKRIQIKISQKKKKKKDMEKYRRNKGQVSRCPISVASHGSGLLAMVCDNMYKVLTAEEVDSGPSWFQLEKLT